MEFEGDCVGGGCYCGEDGRGVVCCKSLVGSDVLGGEGRHTVVVEGERAAFGSARGGVSMLCLSVKRRASHCTDSQTGIRVGQGRKHRVYTYAVGFEMKFWPPGEPNVDIVCSSGSSSHFR